MVDIQRYHVEQKKPDTKKFILYDFIYMKFENKHN